MQDAEPVARQSSESGTQLEDEQAQGGASPGEQEPSASGQPAVAIQAEALTDPSALEPNTNITNAAQEAASTAEASSQPVAETATTTSQPDESPGEPPQHTAHPEPSACVPEPGQAPQARKCDTPVSEYNSKCQTPEPTSDPYVGALLGLSEQSAGSPWQTEAGNQPSTSVSGAPQQLTPGSRKPLSAGTAAARAGLGSPPGPAGRKSPALPSDRSSRSPASKQPLRPISGKVVQPQGLEDPLVRVQQLPQLRQAPSLAKALSLGYPSESSGEQDTCTNTRADSAAQRCERLTTHAFSRQRCSCRGKRVCVCVCVCVCV